MVLKLHGVVKGRSMKILVIGGTGFIGRFVVAQLQKSGHAVMVFHRDKAPVSAAAAQIIGDRNNLRAHRETFGCEKFDLVIDFVLSSGRQARHLVETFRGIIPRLVVLSSMDVYRGWGVFYGFES